MRSNDANKLNLKINQDKTWVELDVGMEGNTLEELGGYLQFCWACTGKLISTTLAFLDDLPTENGSIHHFKDGSIRVIIKRTFVEPEEWTSNGDKNFSLAFVVSKAERDPREIIIAIAKDGSWHEAKQETDERRDEGLVGNSLSTLAKWAQSYFDVSLEEIERSINLFHRTYVASGTTESQTFRMKELPSKDDDFDFEIEFSLLETTPETLLKLIIQIQKDGRWYDPKHGVRGIHLDGLSLYASKHFSCEPASVREGMTYFYETYVKDAKREITTFKMQEVESEEGALGCEFSILQSKDTSELVIWIKKDGSWHDKHLGLGGYNIEELTTYAAGYFDFPLGQMNKITSDFYQAEIVNSTCKMTLVYIQEFKEGDGSLTLEFSVAGRK